MTKITQGFILAAGLGQRMRPLSNDIPKPMVKVHGRPMIDYAFDALADHGIKRCVVNTHYKADVLHDYLANNRWPFEILISHEPDLMDTGGGLRQGLKLLNANEPVFVLSGDSILIDAPHVKTLAQMQNGWDDAATDILLSLQPLVTMTITKGVGDYALIGGTPVRTPDHTGGYMWNSARILHPRIFKDTPATPFSFLPMMDAAQAAGRLAAIVHEGLWHHLSTPDDVSAVNAAWGKP